MKLKLALVALARARRRGQLRPGRRRRDLAGRHQGRDRGARADPGAGTDPGAGGLHLLLPRRSRLRLGERKKLLGDAACSTVRIRPCGPLHSSAIPFTSRQGNVYGGTVGHRRLSSRDLRGDMTFDWRHDQPNKFNGAYAFRVCAGRGRHCQWDSRRLRSSSAAQLVSSTATSTCCREECSRPYVGAGIGFVYNQVSRSYSNTELLSWTPPACQAAAPPTRVTQSKTTTVWPGRRADGRRFLFLRPALGARCRLPRPLPGGQAAR